MYMHLQMNACKNISHAYTTMSHGGGVCVLKGVKFVVLKEGLNVFCMSLTKFSRSHAPHTGYQMTTPVFSF